MERSKRLAVLYGLAAFNGACASATLLGLWLHWRNTLNHCARVDCGCILYAVATYSDVVGGTSHFCEFSALAPLPAAFFAACLGVIYFYSGFIRSKRLRRLRLQYNVVGTNKQPVVRDVRMILAEEERPMSDRNRTSLVARLAMQSALAGVVVTVQFGQVIILTDGFSKTCREYRKTVMRHIDATGNLATMINARMTCTTVLDFMDYMKPDYHKIYGPDFWTPSGKPDWDPGLINSGAAFVFAFIFSYAQLFLWVAVCIYTAMQTRLVIAGRATRRRRAPVMDTAL